MVDVTQGKAYAKSAPKALSPDLLAYMKNEFPEENALWLAAEFREKEVVTERRERLWRRLARGRYRDGRIIGTTRGAAGQSH